MVTMRGKMGDVPRMLHELIELDLDAIEAYKAAIARLEDALVKGQLELFMADHERHVIDLSGLLRGMGQEPPTAADFKRILTMGKVVIGGLIGDRGILSAMRSNEQDTNQAYEQAVARDDLPPRVRTVLEQGLADERRHRAWIESQLGGSRDVA